VESTNTTLLLFLFTFFSCLNFSLGVADSIRNTEAGHYVVSTVSLDTGYGRCEVALLELFSGNDALGVLTLSPWTLLIVRVIVFTIVLPLSGILGLSISTDFGGLGLTLLSTGRFLLLLG